MSGFRDTYADGDTRPSAGWSSIVRHWARCQPGKVAFTFPPDVQGPTGTHVSPGTQSRTSLTYGELDLLTQTYAAHLAELRPSHPVLILYPPGIEYVIALLGCFRAGVVPVPAYPPTARRSALDRLAAMASDTGATLALTTAAGRARMARRAADRPALAGVHTPDVEGWLSGPNLPFTHDDPLPDDLALLQYTSGSTSAPRGVRLTHANLLHNSQVIAHAFGTGPELRAVSWLPLHHDMGLIGGVLQTVYSGGSAALMSPSDFAMDPVRWLRMISETRATMSGGPNFAYDLCAERISPQDLAGLDLSSWEVAFNGAEPISAATLDRFAETMGACGFRREAFTPCYGLAESTLMVTSKPRGGALARATLPRDGGPGEMTVVGSGKAPLGDPLAIVNPVTGEPVDDGVVGEIWVAGPSISKGYLRGAFPHGTLRGESWLRTGDLGFLREGELFVTGRLKDLVVIRGRNLYPQDIERTAAQSHPALPAGGGAAFSLPGRRTEELVIVHEVTRGTPEAELPAIAAAVAEAVVSAHEVRPGRVVLIRASSLPRTTSGKVQRGACRERLLAGELKVLSSAAPAGQSAGRPVADGPEGMIQREAAAILGLAPGEVPGDLPLVSAGLDSLGALRLWHRVRRDHDSSVDLEDAIGMSARELAATLTPREHPHRTAAQPPDREPPREVPVSASQRSMLFMHELAPHSSAYLLSAEAALESPVDVPRLSDALRRLADRHEALRTTFPGGPRQVTHPVLEPDFEHVDCAGWSERELAEAVRQAASKPLDLERGPLLRVRLFSTGPRAHRLVFTVHHLVADLWSVSLLLRDLDFLYQGGRPDVPARTYAEFVGAQAELLSGQEGERLWRFWRERLDGMPAEPALPADRVRPPSPRFRGSSVRLDLDARTGTVLRQLAEAQGVTLFTVLLTAFHILLSRYAGRRDVVVGTPYHGREQAEFAGTAGCFVNTLPLRTTVDPAEPYPTMLRRVHEETREAMRHGAFPFATLVERLRPARSSAHTPLIHAMFSLHQTPVRGLAPFALGREGGELSIGGLALRSLESAAEDAQFDLALAMGDLGDGRLGGTLRYDADLFDESTIGRMAAHFQTIADGIAARSDRVVGALPMLTERERGLLLPPAPGAEPAAALLVERFHEQVLARPDVPAVSCAGETLTYAELGRRSDALARRLAGLGIGAGDIVAVALPRTPDLIVALLGVLRTAAAYLPIDLDLPPRRITDMLDDAGPAAVITEPGSGVDPGGAAVVTMGGTGGPLGEPGAPGPHDLAYVIYTSGSTGRPKGVSVTHGGLAAFCRAAGRLFGLGPGSHVPAITTVSFDIAVLELLVPLTAGATVRLLDRRTARDGTLLRAALETGPATHLQATPGTWQLLLDAGWSGTPALTMLCGGEALPARLAEELAGKGAVLWNLYGPTEATIWSTAAIVGAGRVSIGRAIEGTRAYVLDEALRLVPPGAVGELYIGGMGLARGYHGRPAMTSERFVADPFSRPGARLYRTGDLVRLRPDGELEFLGRSDHQLKVRGHRVEAGEVEAALSRRPGVRRAVVTAHGSTLVAYLEGTPPDQDDLRRALAECLPGYMIPSVFVRLDRLPVTANGKIDRSRLPAPEPVSPPAGEPPATGTERAVAGLVSALLGAEAVGRRQNLFDLGAHSLLLSQLAAQIREAFSVELALHRLFEEPTVAAVAALIDGAERRDSRLGPIRRADRSRYLAARDGGGALELPAALRRSAGER